MLVVVVFGFVVFSSSQVGPPGSIAVAPLKTRQSSTNRVLLLLHSGQVRSEPDWSRLFRPSSHHHMCKDRVRNLNSERDTLYLWIHRQETRARAQSTWRTDDATAEYGKECMAAAETAPLLPVPTGFLKETSSEALQGEERGGWTTENWTEKRMGPGRQIRYRTLTDSRRSRTLARSRAPARSSPPSPPPQVLRRSFRWFSRKLIWDSSGDRRTERRTRHRSKCV